MPCSLASRRPLTDWRGSAILGRESTAGEIAFLKEPGSSFQDPSTPPKKANFRLCKMPSVTIRNVPDEVHRAIRVRTGRHGRSIEAEMRDILEFAVKPQGWVKLGSLLAEIGRKVG